jgi:saccharopine dehydrogenase (NAD+, L-lysine-forming)
MRIALIGAGIIGRVAARDLAARDTPEEVIVGDLDAGSAADVAAECGFDSRAVDVRDPASLAAFLRGADVALNAAQYAVNLDLMRGCLAADCHYLDLGGLFHTTRKQLELDDAFADAGLTAVLGIGSCPGIANVHAGDGAARLDTVEEVLIYNGATVDSSDSLRWPYSLWTILDEIVERPMVFRNGEFTDTEPLSGEELFPFKEPIGTATTHLSLHSEVATIPPSLKEKGIQRCEFRIRHFGFSEAALRKLAFLASVGLADTAPRTVGDVEGVVPRRLLVDLLEASDPAPPQHEGFKDIATVVTGIRDGTPITIRFDTTSWPSPELKVAGGTAVVAVPAAITARWLASGAVDRPGVHPPETSLPPADFYAELARRGAETTRAEEIRLA